MASLSTSSRGSVDRAPAWWRSCVRFPSGTLIFFFAPRSCYVDHFIFITSKKWSLKWNVETNNKWQTSNLQAKNFKAHHFCLEQTLSNVTLVLFGNYEASLYISYDQCTILKLFIQEHIFFSLSLLFRGSTLHIFKILWINSPLRVLSIKLFHDSFGWVESLLSATVVCNLLQ